MNKKIILSIVGVLSVAAFTLSSVKPAEAISPIDWLKSKLSPAQTTNQVNNQNYGRLNRGSNASNGANRAANQEERLADMAKFFNMSVADLQKELSAGKKPYEIAEAKGVDINKWRESRLPEMKEHMKEMGFTDEEIAERIADKNERWQNGNEGCNMMGRGQGRGQGQGQGQGQKNGQGGGLGQGQGQGMGRNQTNR